MKKIQLIPLAMLFVSSTLFSATNTVDQDVMKADVNHDGRVSFEEFKAAHEAEMIARFKGKDVNGDGFIDLEEKQVAIEKQKTQEEAEEEAIYEKLKEKYAKDRETRRKHFFKFQ
jgi:hypothetical protein